MLGKLVEIHPHDAYITDLDSFIGSIWEISDMEVWSRMEDAYDPLVTGYFYGRATLVEGDVNPEILTDGKTHFYAVKFEKIGE